MKKHLIAAAVAGAFAVPAMAQVTVSGVIDVGLVNTENTVAGVKTKASDIGAGRSTSRIIFKGEEDLGGGLKAIFNMEFGTDPTQNSSPGFNSNRDNWAGLSGGFGTIAIGRSYMPAFRAAAAVDPFGSANTGSQTDNVQPFMSGGEEGAYLIRADNAVFYTSPSISGLTLRAVAGSTSSDKSNLNGKVKYDVTGLGATYAAGPLAVQLGYQTLKTATEVVAAVATAAATSTANGVLGTAAVAAGETKRTETVYGGSYDLGVAKIFVGSQERENTTNGAKTSGNEHIQVGVSVPVGALTLLAVMNDGKITGTGGTKTTDTEGTMVGLHYSLSKRTDTYVYLGQGERKAVVGGAKTDYDAMSIGLRHSF